MEKKNRRKIDTERDYGYLKGGKDGNRNDRGRVVRKRRRRKKDR